LEILFGFFMFFVIAGLISIEKTLRDHRRQNKQILNRLDQLIELQKNKIDD